MSDRISQLEDTIQRLRDEALLGLASVDRAHKEKEDLIEAVGEWAFFMGAMFEDCTYLSHESFERDQKKHIEELVALVGEWIPPEIRGEVTRLPTLTLIDYRGEKALILTTEDLLSFGRPRLSGVLPFETRVKRTLESARSRGITALLIITSMPLNSLPKWLRDYIDQDEIRCYRAFFKEAEG